MKILCGKCKKDRTNIKNEDSINLASVDRPFG